MVWSAGRVRRRLGIAGGEVLLAWAPADERGMRVPCPPTAVVRRCRSYVALTDVALWLGHGGVVWRVGLEDVILASVVGASDGAPTGTGQDVPVGALRVDLVHGDPLVLLVMDGGVFPDRLAREIRAFDQELHRAALHHVGSIGPAPWLQVGAGRGTAHPSRRVAHPGAHGDGHPGVHGDALPTVAGACPGGDHPTTCWPDGPDGSADARQVLHQADLIVRRELRRVLTARGSSARGSGR